MVSRIIGTHETFVLLPRANFENAICLHKSDAVNIYLWLIDGALLAKGKLRKSSLLSVCAGLSRMNEWMDRRVRVTQWLTYGHATCESARTIFAINLFNGLSYEWKSDFINGVGVNMGTLTYILEYDRLHRWKITFYILSIVYERELSLLDRWYVLKL